MCSPPLGYMLVAYLCVVVPVAEPRPRLSGAAQGVLHTDQYGQFPHVASGLRCFMIYIPVALVQGIVYVCVCTAIVIQFGRQFRDAGRESGISD